MTHERSSTPAQRKPYELFGLTENEFLSWRVSRDRLEEIIQDEGTFIHTIEPSSNNFGEFLFVTTSREGDKGRIFITFFGLGYHEYRERWLTDEWFWYQTEPKPGMMRQQLSRDEAEKQLLDRFSDIRPHIKSDSQTERGRLFELLADLTDEDGALAEMQDLRDLTHLIEAIQSQDDETELVSPTVDNLLDDDSRKKLPPLYSGEGQGLDALAKVKFFTPDSNWTWYASEFDGEDIFFGLVIGFEIELGYFSLKEMQEARGPMGLPIERDLYYDPLTLKELMENHRRDRGD